MTILMSLGDYYNNGLYNTSSVMPIMVDYVIILAQPITSLRSAMEMVQLGIETQDETQQTKRWQQNVIQTLDH